MNGSSRPAGLLTLIFGELCERFSYYGAQAILVLYLSKVFLFSDSKSYAIYGVYTTFIFILPVAGGILADRLIGFRKSIILGALLLIMGNLLLAVPDFYCFCAGLTISICGTGLYKGNTTGLVGALYASNDPYRESGFTWLYMGMNIGATLGAIIYGLLASTLGCWHCGFLFSAVGISIALLAFLRNKPLMMLNQEPLASGQHFGLTTIGPTTLVCLILSLICALIAFTLFKPSLLGYALIIFVIMTPIIVIFLTKDYATKERKRILALLVLPFFAMFFFAASLQVGSSIMVFINSDIHRTVFGWEIPAILFGSLYPLAVICMAPLATVFWRFCAKHHCEPTTPSKLCLGLIFASVGFICFAMAAKSSSLANYIPLVWIVLGNLCLGCGELVIFPPMLAAISLYAPTQLRGTLIGICFVFVAFGGYLSSVIANLSLVVSADNANIYNQMFITVSITMLIVALLLVGLIPWLKVTTALENIRN